MSTEKLSIEEKVEQYLHSINPRTNNLKQFIEELENENRRLEAEERDLEMEVETYRGTIINLVEKIAILKCRERMLSERIEVLRKSL